MTICHSFATPPSDSSYLQLKLSATKILSTDVVTISGASIRVGNFKTVSMTITGPAASVSKTLPLTDSGAFTTTWQATGPGNYKITVKASSGKEQQTVSLDVYRLLDMDKIVDDNIDGLQHAYDNLEKQSETIMGQLEQKYGGLPGLVTGDLSQLSTLMSTQAQQIDQANIVAGHKPYDNSICECLVMVSEACAACRRRGRDPRR